MNINLRAFDLITSTMFPPSKLTEELMKSWSCGAAAGDTDVNEFDNLVWMLGSTKTDDNGNQIFAGDILKYTRHKWKCHGHPEDGKDISNILVVRFCEETMSMKLDMYNEKRCFMHGDFSFNDSRAEKISIKIIGNIYENADLLPSS